jgi:hypothetical protein
VIGNLSPETTTDGGPALEGDQPVIEGVDLNVSGVDLCADLLVAPHLAAGLDEVAGLFFMGDDVGHGHCWLEITHCPDTGRTSVRESGFGMLDEADNLLDVLVEFRVDGWIRELNQFGIVWRAMVGNPRAGGCCKMRVS